MNLQRRLKRLYSTQKIKTIFLFAYGLKICYHPPMTEITPATCRAGRGLLDITQKELAAAARVGLSTVKAFEGQQSTPIANNLLAIQVALEAAGIEFIAENGGGAGVRMKERGT